MTKQRCRIVGILNVTPDSFSDGGHFHTPAAAIAHARTMADEGADIIDVGAESTRPGHTPVSAEEEWARLAPVLPDLIALGVPISVDTTKPAVAQSALAAGAAIINDQWGLHREPELARLAADYGAILVAMHNDTAVDPDRDIIAHIHAFFDKTMETAAEAGLAHDRVVLDPGIGFGKTVRQNLAVIENLDALVAIGPPVFLGTSRKSFIGKTLDREVGERLAGTLAVNTLAMAAGVAYVRVHDVRPHLDAAHMVAAVARSARSD